MNRQTPTLLGICIIVSATMAGATSESTAHEGWTKKDCDKTRQKIAKIESKMRQGYSASQGVKMEDELRRLRKLRSKQCR